MPKSYYDSAKSAFNQATTRCNSVVPEDYKLLPLSSDYYTSSKIVSPCEAIYRSSILRKESVCEYSIWSETNTDLTSSSLFDYTDATGFIPEGGFSVQNGLGTESDGSDFIFLNDVKGRSIKQISSLVIRRGDTNTIISLTSSDLLIDLYNDRIFIQDTPTSQALGVVIGNPPCVSKLRGDNIESVTYKVHDAEFSWTKNDSNRSRMEWNNQSQRWEPLKGGSYLFVGKMEENKNYTISMIPTSELHTFLSGDSLYSQIRVGTEPDDTSILLNVPTGVYIISDDEIETFLFSSQPNAVAAISLPSGTLIFESIFARDNTGLSIWCDRPKFGQSTGYISRMSEAIDSSIYISPVPFPGEIPLIRFGSRKYLEVIPVFSDTELALISPSKGEVSFSYSSGKLKFNLSDLQRSDSLDPAFEKTYLLESIFYDGVRLNLTPNELRSPTRLLNGSGVESSIGNDLFIPDANLFHNPGKSGILHILDKTGSVPKPGVPTARPGGDNINDSSTGLIRSLGSEALVFTKSKVFVINQVNNDSDLPDASKIASGEIYISLEKSTYGSRVRFSTFDLLKYTSEVPVFLQPVFTPYSQKKLSDYYVSEYVDSIVNFPDLTPVDFYLDGINYVWTPDQISMTLEDIISSINTLLGFPLFSQFRNRILISTLASFELSPDSVNASFLGFNPLYSYTSIGNTELSYDSGISFEFLKDFQKNIDFYRTKNYDTLLSQKIPDINTYLLSTVPLRDQNGSDFDQFFSVSDGINNRTLINFSDIYYDFANSRFKWINIKSEEGIITDFISFLKLQSTQLTEFSFLNILGNFLKISNGSSFTDLVQDVDFKYLYGGSTGTIAFTEEIAPVVYQGQQGYGNISTNSFLELSGLDFTTTGIQSEQFLILDEKAYLINSVSPSQLVVASEFEEIYRGDWKVLDFSSSTYDPGILADVVWADFQHLPEEPFIIQVLSPCGLMPISVPDQLSNRRTCYISEALVNKRDFSLVYGLDGVSVSLYLLQVSNLGKTENGIFLQGVGTDRYITQSFSILLGTNSYTHTSGLVPVISFSPSVPSNTIEYLTATGELKFSEDLLSNFGDVDVIQKEEFLPAASLLSGNAEVNTEGLLNISSSDITSHQTKQVYFLERYIVKNRTDVTVSPLSGSVGFRKPLRNNQIVQATYFPADLSGDPVIDKDGNIVIITEYLPIFVSLEVATRINARNYSYNPTSKIVDDQSSVVVYVGSRRQNFANDQDYIISGNSIIFNKDIPIDSVVKISYAVLNCFGGETTFEVSTKPFYRKPFFLLKNQNVFSLSTDRTNDLFPGKLFNIGTDLFYIKSSTYNVSDDLTEIEIYPTPLEETGSRVPGQLVNNRYSSKSIATSVDGVAVSGNAGFWSIISDSFDPIRKNQTTIRLHNPSVFFAKANHILELNGVPYLIKSSKSVDQQYTDIELISLTRDEVVSGTLKISVRPIFDDFSTSIQNFFPIFPEDPYILIHYNHQSNEGMVLRSGIDYRLDVNTGSLEILNTDYVLTSDVSLRSSYTKIDVKGPLSFNGSVLYPRYRAKYSQYTIPSEMSPPTLGMALYFTGKTYSPDSYFVAIRSTATLKSEIENQVLSLSSDTTNTLLVPFSNSSMGKLANDSLPLLVNKDRVAREEILLLNDLVNAFDQIIEMIDCKFIGNANGYFNFFLGQDSDFTPPGYQNDITGEMNSRNITLESLESEIRKISGFNIRVVQSDYLIEPNGSINLSSGILTGDSLSMSTFNQILSIQKVRNDIDDISTDGRTVPVLIYQAGTRISLSKGNYKNLGISSLSRFFPKKGNFYLTTLPGLGDPYPGFYTYSRIIDGVRQSTYQTVIGSISNHTLGNIQYLQNVILSRRYPRYRVFGYSVVGYPTLDISSDGVPSMILSAVPLEEFPVDFNGNIDTLKFLSLGGTISDIVSGVTDLSLPGIKSGDPAIFGNSEVQSPLYDSNFPYFIEGVLNYAPIYIDTVSVGCLVTFKDSEDNQIVDPNRFLIYTMGQYQVWSPQQGDTLLSGAVSVSTVPLSDPITSEDSAKLLSMSPSYNIGVDIAVNLETGELIDITKPSYADGVLFPLKEISGQNPPQPLQDLEGTYNCSDTRTTPVIFPSLLGEDKNDSGDYQYPHIDRGVYEKKYLRELHNLITDLSSDTFLPDAQYPFEIDGNGTIDSFGRLSTATNLLPVNGPYVPNSGLADARPYDLIFFRIGGTSTTPVGMQGISSVADVFEDSGSYFVRTPRFVSPSTQGERIRYVAANIIYSTGLSIEDDGVETIITIPNTANLYLNDGSVGNLGGLNHILNHPSNLFGSNENSVIIRIVHPISGLITQEIEITGDATLGQGRVTSGLGTVNFLTPVVISQYTITIPASGFVDPSLYSGSFPGTIGPFEYSISVDTYSLGISGLLVNKGSFTGFVGDNRISFYEAYDLRNIAVDGTLTPGGQDIKTTLNIYHVTGKYSDAITVNSGASVNNLAPFIFLESGTFTPSSFSGAGDEIGNTDVPSYMEYGNILGSGSSDFSILTTTKNNQSSIILEAEGTCEGTSSQDHQVVTLVINQGQMENVEKGDILCITESSDATIDGGAAPSFNGKASVKCGSYIVRSVVVSDDFGSNPKYRKLSLTTKFGSVSGWVSSPFPSVVGFDQTLNTIEVTTLNPFSTPSIIDSPTGHAFPSSGRIYLLLNLGNMSNPSTNDLFKESIYSAAYSSITGNIFMGISDWRDGLGDPVTEDLFFQKLFVGIPISGMRYLPIQLENQEKLHDREIVGISDPSTVSGFRYLTYEGNNGSVVFDGSLGDISSFPSVAGSIGIKDKTKSSSTGFIPYSECVYDNVPGMIDLGELTSIQWENLHSPGLPVVLTNTLSISCLLPVDSLVTENGGTEGFRAKAGIFLEPSVPIFPYNIGSGYSHVVDAGHTLLSSDIEMRDSSSFGVLSPGSTDYVRFEVRRTRRFTESDTTIPDYLRSCYEIRKGTLSGYSQDNLQRGVVTSSGTQFGDFTHILSAINDGDLFRLMDATGNLVQEVEISTVVNSTTLLLASPGITSVLNPVGYSFEIYKKGHLIPHEQSFEVMVQKTTTKIYESIADYETEEGAYVLWDTDYETSINILRDTNITGIGVDSYLVKGVEVGDYLVIDPQGPITFTGNPVPQESGEPPKGDLSVIGRASYLSGGTSNLDDNRGVYKVIEVYSDHLVVSSENVFSGDLLTDIIFEEATNNAYVVYPTIHNSGLSISGREGQNDLRPTSYRDMSGSYSSTNRSIAPFTYRIFRPTGIISDETLQLILCQRERVKSLIQQFTENLHLGYRYWDLQNDQYLTNWDLGLPITEEIQSNLLGDLLVTPYANSRTCLSLLDRRFWIKDLTLEGTYSDFASGIGLPVLPDRITSSVNFEEPIRKNREAWISYRITKPSGTLRAISSAREERKTLENQRKNQIKIKR